MPSTKSTLQISLSEVVPPIRETAGPNDEFGFSAAPAGDVNGDGYADVIVGAHGYDDGADSDAG
ncbi:MAG: FG-GAP repeat protein [Chloroflexia bacterium]|nr:FG-GAP repeat protein [Chloroflexia bacterium]